eukprot:TRINITY_DN8823_c0_g1_i11.p2 TRINITY_DN8823_c0_g1~~TRINITY_DN8823_c0_g1_i11.p2  ORF type:complete len:310 (-),score=-7.99 TRINITY_DN8823_c0_g1_i11:193-1122(-)
MAPKKNVQYTINNFKDWNGQKEWLKNCLPHKRSQLFSEKILEQFLDTYIQKNCIQSFNLNKLPFLIVRKNRNKQLSQTTAIQKKDIFNLRYFQFKTSHYILESHNPASIKVKYLKTYYIYNIVLEVKNNKYLIQIFQSQKKIPQVLNYQINIQNIKILISKQIEQLKIILNLYSQHTKKRKINQNRYFYSFECDYQNLPYYHIFQVYFSTFSNFSKYITKHTCSKKQNNNTVESIYNETRGISLQREFICKQQVGYNNKMVIITYIYYNGYIYIIQFVTKFSLSNEKISFQRKISLTEFSLCNRIFLSQ